MSNIGKTSANIKKKLSFGDYRKSAKQQSGKKAKQSTSKQVSKPTINPVHKLASKPVAQPIVKTAPLHDITPVIQQAVIPATQQVGTTVEQHTSKKINHSMDMPAQQQNPKKTKATFYLGEKEEYMLTQLFIQGLTRKQKIDKSALVCEAIRLLYERKK
jgi:hypothetical protein